ncbi:protein-serine/threonine phosphatase [Malassezia caprae]|uniref:RNA polymerase II subunit A C-terminal domain phosphatase n=1 Tax=Malassezia caprae TaxID=1381934 RepID=A0AAF0E887_9BASI|nr:protein-serine/threonine phosphatase [Malassezia caprae]
MACEHPIQVAGLCAVCGKEIEEGSFDQPTFATLHSSASVKVSRDEAIRMDTEDTKHLIEQQKLALIVDLDQTIIHVTVDPTVKEWAHDPKNPNWDALKDVVAFQLGADGTTVSHQPERLDPDKVTAFATGGDENGCWYYVKLRPGLDHFLTTLASKYELHVYTMGTRSYADCICRIVDPDGHKFGARILSRDENGSDMQKSLARLFPISTDMVVIIDDRADVWSWSPNLIKVEPYEFFVGIGDINAAHLGPAKPLVPTAPPADKPADSQEPQNKELQEQIEARPLKRKLEEALEHKSAGAPAAECATSEPEAQPEAEIIEEELLLRNDDTELELIEANVIKRMKGEVLKGCEIVFSGLIPVNQVPETATIWTMAEDFGAKCHRDLVKSPHTVKAEQAYRRGDVQVVWPSWLNDSICSWVRQGEAAYLIPRNTELSLLPPEAQDLTQSTMSEALPDDQQMMDNLAHMDWGEAEDEVDAFLDDDDTETDNDSLLGSGLTDANAESSQLVSPRRRVADARPNEPSKLRNSILAESDDMESDAKRRKTDSTARAVSPSEDNVLSPQSPGSDDQNFLDDLALEMERELNDDEL